MKLSDLRNVKDVPNPVFLLSSELAFISDFGIDWEEGVILIQDSTTNLPVTLSEFLEETRQCPDNMEVIVRTMQGRTVGGSLSLCDKNNFFKNL